MQTAKPSVIAVTYIRGWSNKSVLKWIPVVSRGIVSLSFFSFGLLGRKLAEA